MHGANKFGIPFTGDFSGTILDQALAKYNFTSSEKKIKYFKNVRVTNAVRCLPPNNKPTTLEINNCNIYLRDEIHNLKVGSVILSLGRVAHYAVIKALALKKENYPFNHSTRHNLIDKYTLINSYHCSKYNINTKKLTKKNFFKVFEKINKYLIK